MYWVCVRTEQNLYILMNSTSSDQEVIREMKVHEFHFYHPRRTHAPKSRKMVAMCLHQGKGWANP